ncbi:MAG: hypothetical protein GXY44_12405 [Phycisphaerales bacterium]|nr:hypothetical protein [Phycisphaerales bacterium]
MPESQEDIDALLAEVSALADQAVADITGPDTLDTEPAVPPPAVVANQPAVTAPRPPRSPVPKDSRKSNVERILNLEVPVIVRLAERVMPLLDVVNLCTGAIIEFDKPSDSELDLMINNKCIGNGQAVKVGENFGLRINHIGSVQERIRAMGGGLH